MAGSYEDLLKQQELYKKQLEEIKKRENREIVEKNLESEKNFKYPRNKKYKSAVALFIELIYKEINGIAYPRPEDLGPRYKPDFVKKYIPEQYGSDFSPENLTVKKDKEIIEVTKAIPKGNIKNGDKDTKEEIKEENFKKSKNRIRKRKPKRKKRIKKFPRIIATNPKKKSKKEKSNLDSISKTISNIETNIKRYNANIANIDKNLKKEIPYPTQIMEFEPMQIKGNSSHEYHEPSWDEIDEHIQKSSEQMRYAMLENEVISSINSENYSKANMLVSVLTERQRETQREVDQLRKDIATFKAKNEAEEDIKDLQKQKQELDLLLLQYNRRINILLPIISTMNSKKTDSVKYNRKPINGATRFRFENTDFDQHMISMGNVQSSLAEIDGGSSQPYETEKYIYFEIDDFLKMKEIEQIIKYNNKKGIKLIERKKQ